MKKQQALPKVLAGTLILSLAGLITKILSAVYRVPFQNLVGDVGFYTYQQVYPFYGLEVTLALSGLPVFISRLVAEQDDLDQQRAVARRCWWLLLAFGLGIALLLFGGAPWIARGMGDRHLASVIRGLAPAFLLMPWLAVGRGFAQGQLKMEPTAYSQVGEQIVRVTMIITVAVLAVQKHWSVYRTGMLAMASAPVAALVALLILLPTWQQIWRPESVPLDGQKRLRWSVLARRIVREGLLLCWLSSIMVVLQLVDSFTVKRGLLAAGMPAALANVQKGIFDRGQPLVQLGLVVATSFSATLLPALAEHWRQGDMKGFATTYRVLVHAALVLASFATAGLVFLMPQINELLFVSRRGSGALAVMMLSIPLVTIIALDCSALQSSNRFRAMLLALTAGLVVKAVINYPLAAQIGITGASLGTVSSLLVTAVLTHFSLPGKLRHWNCHHFSGRLLGLALLMGFVVNVLARFLESWLGRRREMMIVVLAIAIPVGALVAVIGLVKLQILVSAEWEVIPGGHWLIRKIKKRG